MSLTNGPLDVLGRSAHAVSRSAGHVLARVVGNDGAVANARRLGDERRHQQWVVAGLVATQPAAGPPPSPLRRAS